MVGQSPVPMPLTRVPTPHGPAPAIRPLVLTGQGHVTMCRTRAENNLFEANVRGTLILYMLILLILYLILLLYYSFFCLLTAV